VGAKKAKLGVLISGSGTNLQAIIDACKESSYPATVAVVISSKADAYGLVRAAANNIPHYAVLRSNFTSEEEFNLAILNKLQEHQVDLVVLAGYMRLVSKSILNAYPQAVINLHPALLPAFPGAHAVEDALNYGVKITGITIHFADEQYDTGPIIMQEIVPVHQNDTKESLLERIHKVEHRYLPYAIKLWATNRLKVEGRKVLILPRNHGVRP
jgi:phosphoribosylglycinamide formyltransferase-1